VLMVIVSCATAFAQSQDRIIVISGGGAYGAWGAGLCQRLHDVEKKSYKIAIGTSTGSLMAPLVLREKFDTLKMAYTSVTQSSIFSVSPFKSNGDIRPLVAGWRFIFNNSLGETYPLRALIKKWFTQTNHKSLQAQGKELIVTTANMTDGQPYYMSSNKFDYDNTDAKFGGKHHNWNSMVNWIWASANEPVFMSIFKTARFDTATLQQLKDANGKLTKDVYVWQDGGITQAVSLMEGLKKAYKSNIYNVDVIVHGTSNSEIDSYDGHGVFTGLKRTISILTHSVKSQNIQAGILQAEANKASCATPAQNFTIIIYYMRDDEYKLQPNNNELVFNTNTMKTLYEAGFAGKAEVDTIKVPIATMKGYLEKEEARRKRRK